MMKKLLPVYPVMLCLFFLNSCLIQAPKYTKVERVFKLELGMTRQQIEDTLGIAPYDFKSTTDSTDVMVYVYRVQDRKVLPFFVKPTNGTTVRGKYVSLFVTYSKGDSKALHIESCSDCAELKAQTQKLDFDKLLTFITITLPVVLVYLGLK